MIQYKTKISIDGKYLKNFEQVTLKQSINNHHSFKVVVDHDAVELPGSHTLDASKEWLGKSIVISFDETEFLGIITNIRLVHDNGHQGDIELSGYSKTILLEQGKHTTSWLNKSLLNIVRDTVETTTLEAQINPINKDLLDYETQYGESNFGFIQRLAKQHNEWLYYDGIKLIFGKPTIGDATALEYGRHLSNISIGIQAKVNSFNIFSYSSNSNTLNESKTKNDVEGLNELGMKAFDTSLEIFNTVPNSHSNNRTKDKSQLESGIGKKQAASVADLNVLEADCNQQNLTVGSMIKLSSAKWDGKNTFDVKNYGEYMIIEIEHHATGNTTYSSHFKAIPGGVTILPEPEVEMPQAGTQIATVVSNADPMGQGRVQVQFLWQKYEQKTSWIRVMTPDAGSSDHHSQNRGHVFIPEEGDQVMVGFRYGDPNRPFVMGSMFHGQNGAGGQTDNTIKSIITRSGHVIEFNDTEKAESITITDRKGNLLIIDTAGETITISALKDININAGENINIRAGKNITVNAGENIDEMAGQNITTNAGKDISIKATGDITEASDNRTELVDETFNRQAEISNEVAGEISIFSQEENMTLQSGKTVEFNSVEKSNLF